MKKFIFMFLLANVFAPAAHADFEETALRRLDGSQITFYLDRPKTGSFPIILFLQGSECHSVLGRDSMPKNPSLLFGTGFLMIEKYGITKNQTSEKDDENCTKEFNQSNTLNQRILDALKVISYLRNQKISGWNHRLLIIGGSEGGMLAPILATLIPEAKKVAMIAAGNGRTMLEDTREALALTARKRGFTDATILQLLSEFDIKTTEIKTNPSSEKMYLGHSFLWWNSVLWIKPVNWMLDLEIPQLLIHGTTDTSVPVASARASVDAFKIAGKSYLSYWEVNDCDHALIDSHGTSHKMEYLLKAIQWLVNE